MFKICSSSSYWAIALIFWLCRENKQQQKRRANAHRNHIQFQVQNFQLKLFDIAVNLKYDQGNWKWIEQVKLNE